MSSRWQAYKIGFINFWYYDEQEFPFAEGRILLRGSNGSGKSVTMQSVVPLLLDGNTRPERLDPFGSRDRKMSTYLLEEEDPRQERTGYLYLELKREESETYITVGMGIRARRGKPLDTWYFGITDGRRVGKDIFLYRNTGDKITLSRQELENRIGEGGKVFTRQPDYMAYVNRQIFGFDTVQQYGEMIDLLIQLRTPKLSRDFKPTVINDILSDSLQPLSDEDLRPMAEAIENMDTLELNLRTQKDAGQAADKIWHVLNLYNRRILCRRATDYAESLSAMNDMKTRRAETEEKLKAYEGEIESLTEEYDALQVSQKAKEQQRELLMKNDAFEVKSRVDRLKGEVRESSSRLDDKEKQISKKNGTVQKLREKLEEREQERDRRKDRLLKDLDEMQPDAQKMGFEEHSFFSDEVKAKFDEPVSAKTHRAQLSKTRDRIRNGMDLLGEIREKEKTVSELTQRRDELQKQADRIQRKRNEAQEEMLSCVNTWKEDLFSWNAGLRVMEIARETLTDFAKIIDRYDTGTDFQGILDVIGHERDVRNSQIVLQLNKLEGEAEEHREQIRALQEEISDLENMKEPEPEREECVMRSRLRLRKMQIPYCELYRLLSFDENLSEEVCDRLEEALVRMGILDAVVVDEAYREQVMKPVKGCADRYLFLSGEKPAHSLLNVLEPDLENEDLFLNQYANEILGSIAWNEEGITAVYENGNYQIGALSGTTSAQYQAGFIGRKARERNRQQQIAARKESIRLLENETAELEERLSSEKEKKRVLDIEYNGFPRDRKLREAARSLEDLEYQLNRLQKDGEDLDSRITQISGDIRERHSQALEIAGQLYLKCSYDVFCSAMTAAGSYEQKLTGFIAGHSLYLNNLQRIQELDEDLDEAQQDLTLYENERAKIRLDMAQSGQELEMAESQLRLTGYEQIREELDSCISWLNAYPVRLSECAEKRQRARSESQRQTERLKHIVEETTELDEKIAYLQDLYESELSLGYADEFLERKDGEIPTPSAVLRVLKTGPDLPEEQKLVGRLNEVFFQDYAKLSEYSPNIGRIFEDKNKLRQNGWPEAGRLDIDARYQGVKVPFSRLTEMLHEEVERLQGLIRDGDRELFEDILSNIVGRKIRGKINESRNWVEQMNLLMKNMDTSSGLSLSLRWRARTADAEEQLDTRDLVNLLRKDFRLMRDDEAERMTRHFRSKVEEARRKAADLAQGVSFYQVMKDTLDYRKWFEFQLFFRKGGEREKELTNSVFGTFSGGEKAMAMYVPLFSAVVAKYKAAREDAPRIISLDEAFAGVDRRNIRDMFKLMAEFRFNFIINSQVLWGDADTLDALAIYQLLRPNNVKFVTVMPYLWNGNERIALESEKEIEKKQFGQG